MADVLIDSNVLLDVLTDDSRWAERSAAVLARLADGHDLVLNPIVYAEVSIGFDRIEDVEAALPGNAFRREALPWEAAFLAGKCFLRYRRAGGARRAPLPDFYIGAHAAVRGMPLVTRDVARYRSYFPKLALIQP
ncbi:MAG TPA: type II toxin-antitoxin system VapC family toxin [Methylomirabilota bacterium]|nr:type II toxin-antitoxin system VapC family toxin [Methylomirabilota bacterium]